MLQHGLLCHRWAPPLLQLSGVHRGVESIPVWQFSDRESEAQSQSQTQTWCVERRAAPQTEQAQGRVDTHQQFACPLA